LQRCLSERVERAQRQMRSEGGGVWRRREGDVVEPPL
jgi:hypothetical protein